MKSKKIKKNLINIVTISMFLLIVCSQCVYANSSIEYLRWISFKSTWLIPTIGLVIYLILTISYEILKKSSKKIKEGNYLKIIKFQIIILIIFILILMFAGISSHYLNEYLENELPYSGDYEYISFLAFKNGKIYSPSLGDVGLTTNSSIVANYQEYLEIINKIGEYLDFNYNKYDEEFFENSSLIMISSDYSVDYNYSQSLQLIDVVEDSETATIIFDEEKINTDAGSGRVNSADIYLISVSNNITSFSIEYKSIRTSINTYIEICETLMYLSCMILVATAVIILIKTIVIKIKLKKE